MRPSSPTGGPRNRLDKRDFIINIDGASVTCPAGHTAPIGTDRSGRRRALFNKDLCGPCALRRRCIGPRSTFKPLRLNSREELLMAGRRALEDPVAAEHLRRTRPRIERPLGLLAHRYKARKSRYIGSRKAGLQAAWTAALVNLNPLGRRLTTTA
ncbi:MAG TPA: transposase [Baekduia sp.]|nr:transposase [Baekduia sp.]